METFILYAGSFGAWLLFAGSIYQAALELQDEDIEVDRIRAAGSKVKLPKKVSAWWWLLPPVKFYKELKYNRVSRELITKSLSSQDLEAMVSFSSKARAWLIVSVGGIFIASKETYELTDHNQWGTAVFVWLIVGMFILSILHLVYNLRQAKEMKGIKKD